MRLKLVTKEDYRFLYKLLKEKKEEQNISHQSLPTFKEHCKFNNRKPYREDYIVKAGKRKVGRIYVTRENEVGIAILGRYHGSGYGTEALELILEGRKCILANISPKNKISQRFFRKHGFKLIQYTYRWEKS